MNREQLTEAAKLLDRIQFAEVVDEVLAREEAEPSNGLTERGLENQAQIGRIFAQYAMRDAQNVTAFRALFRKHLKKLETEAASLGAEKPATTPEVATLLNTIDAMDGYLKRQPGRFLLIQATTDGGNITISKSGLKDGVDRDAPTLREALAKLASHG